MLRPVYDETQGRDGYVSLECSPYLANDTEATVVEAMRLWGAVDRPNLMVKVPATPAGIPAVRELIGRGLNINITLLFAVEVYEQVVEAYISGLEDLARAGGDISRSAASPAFLSAVSTAPSTSGSTSSPTSSWPSGFVARSRSPTPNSLMPATRRCSPDRAGKLLAAAGAKTQRLLWASTSTKNPAYKDTMYVEALVGRDTVDTIPPATMDAFRDHGVVTPDAIEQDVAGARAILAALERYGISLKEITDELVIEGVQQFADAFDKLFGVIAGSPPLTATATTNASTIALGSAAAEVRLRRGNGDLAQGGAYSASLGRRQDAVDRDGRRQVARMASISWSDELTDVERLQRFCGRR